MSDPRNYFGRWSHGDLPRGELMTRSQVVDFKNRLSGEPHGEERVGVCLYMGGMLSRTETAVKKISPTFPDAEDVAPLSGDAKFAAQMAQIVQPLMQGLEHAISLPDSRWPLDLPVPEQFSHALGRVKELEEGRLYFEEGMKRG